jgi:transposase
MQSYSQDLRERVLRALDRGARPTEIARRFEVSRFWVYRVRDRQQETGLSSSFQIGGHRRSRLAERERVLRDWIAAGPDLTLTGLQQGLAQHAVVTKIATLWHRLNKWKLTFWRQLAKTSPLPSFARLEGLENCEPKRYCNFRDPPHLRIGFQRNSRQLAQLCT